MSKRFNSTIMAVSKEFEELWNTLFQERVRHDVDTSDECTPNNLSWIEYWKQETNNCDFSAGSPICPSCGKTKPARDFVGAHVIDESNNKYICPTCKDCNSKYKGDNAKAHWFKVKKSLLLSIPR